MFISFLCLCCLRYQDTKRKFTYAKKSAAALADSTGRGPCAEYQLFFIFKKVFKWFAVAAKYSGAKFFFPCGAARR